MTDPTSNQPSLATDLTGADRVGSDEFFYDIFGINIKGLKSIWVIFVRPTEYFNAARLPDWGGDHWPSIRIWLGLMGILIAMQFLWASESSEMTAMFQQLAIVPADAAKETLAANDITLEDSGVDKRELGKKAFKQWIFIYPFFFIASMCALAFIFRAWKPAIGFVVRLRFIFAVIIPGSVFGLLLTLLMINLTGELYQLASLLSIPAMIIIYAATAYRGPFHDFDKGERIGMSVVVGLLIMFFLLVAQTISMLISVVPAWIEVAEIITPQLDAARDAKGTAN